MAAGFKTGGRKKGTPNKGTAEIRSFIQRVFERAMADPQFELELVLKLVTLQIDTRMLDTLLKYGYGVPTKQVDHTHKGKVTLEQIVAGVAVDEDPDEDEDGE